jgi:hypothetical protein
VSNHTCAPGVSVAADHSGCCAGVLYARIGITHCGLGQVAVITSQWKSWSAPASGSDERRNVRTGGGPWLLVYYGDAALRITATGLPMGQIGSLQHAMTPFGENDQSNGIRTVKFPVSAFYDQVTGLIILRCAIFGG